MIRSRRHHRPCANGRSITLRNGVKRENGPARSSLNTPELQKNGDLPELIGVILGDGHIENFPRTQRIVLVSNISNPGFVDRYSSMLERVFGKKPKIWKQKDKNCIRIGFYESLIGERLGISTGSRKNLAWITPNWIKEDKLISIRFLRGLFEAEGSESHHTGTYTHKLSFSNINKALLDTVFELLCTLGFHPSRDAKRVQLSRKAEVSEAVQLLEFRRY